MKTVFYKFFVAITLTSLSFTFLDQVSAQTAASATWALTSNGNASVSGSVTALPIAIGSGINNLSHGGTSGATTGSWSNDANNLVNDEYYEYSISPSTGTNLSITSISGEHSNSAGNWIVAVYYSKDAFATSSQVGADFSINSTSSTAFNLSSLAYAVNEGETFSIRIYAWESDGSNRSYRNKNIVISGTTTINCVSPVFTAVPEDTSRINVSQVYTTYSGKSNYVWTIPGISGTDYTLVSGGTSSSNSATIQWKTTGVKQVKVNYSITGCSTFNPDSASTYAYNNIRYAVASANWNVNSSWSATSGGTAGASFPVAGDLAYIGENNTDRTITIPANHNAAVGFLIIGTQSDNTDGNLNFSASTSSLTVGGSVWMQRSSTSVTRTISIGAGSMTVGLNLELSKNSASANNNNRITDVTISTGTLTVNRNILFDAEDAAQSQIVFSGAGTLNLGGNFTYLNGLGTFTKSSSTVNLNGSSAQSISGPNDFNNLTTSGGSQTTLLNNVSVSGILTMTKGYIIADPTNSRTLTIASTGSISGGSVSSFVIGSLSKINIASSTTFNFPVGSIDNSTYAVRYRPVVLSNVASATNQYTVRHYWLNPYNNGLSAINQTVTGTSGLQIVSNLEYWNINSASNVQASVKLPYDIYAASAVTDLTKIMIGNYRSSKWERSTGTRVAPDAATKSITYTGVTTFGNFTIASTAAAALPVILTSFTAKPTSTNTVALNWATSSEIVNKGFRIERQAGGVNGKFESLGFVASKANGGNSQTALYYNFIDANPRSGATAYYRLAQEDLDGKTTFSEVRVVKFNGETVSMVFPNPSNGAVNISRTANGKKMNVQVIDMAGRMLQQFTNITDSNFKLNISKSGMYNIKMTYPESGEQSVQRIVIER